MRRPRLRRAGRVRVQRQQQVRPNEHGVSVHDAVCVHNLSRASQKSVMVYLIGSRFASCGGDRQIFLWDVATGRTIRKLAGHDGVVNSVRTSSVLMSGHMWRIGCVRSSRHALRPGNGKLQWRWQAIGRHFVAEVLWAPRPIRVMMWCRCKLACQEASMLLMQVAYSPNDEVLASAGYDQAVKVWDCRSRSWEPIQTMRVFADSVTSVTVTEQCARETLLPVVVWPFRPDLMQGRAARRGGAHAMCLTGASLCHGGAHDCLDSAAVEYDTFVRPQSCTAASRCTWLTAHNGVTTVSDGPSGTCRRRRAEIVAGGVDGTVRRFDVRMGLELGDDLGAPVTCVAVSHDGNCLLAACTDGALRLLDKQVLRPRSHDGSASATSSTPTKIMCRKHLTFCVAFTSGPPREEFLDVTGHNRLSCSCVDVSVRESAATWQHGAEIHASDSEGASVGRGAAGPVRGPQARVVQARLLPHAVRRACHLRLRRRCAQP